MLHKEQEIDFVRPPVTHTVRHISSSRSSAACGTAFLQPESKGALDDLRLR